MGDDKIIRFPSGESGKSAKGKAKESAAAEPKPGVGALDAAGLAALSADQRKASGIVLSGMPFVLIGIKPTQSGADFFTALGGEPADLRNASDHLPGVIERALSKRGI